MKIKELLYKTPEMTEERLLEIICDNINSYLNGSIINKVN